MEPLTLLQIKLVLIQLLPYSNRTQPKIPGLKNANVINRELLVI